MSDLRVTLVAAIDPSRTRPGGIRAYVLGLAKYLDRAGVSVTLVGTGEQSEEAPFEFISASTAKNPSSADFLRALRRLAGDISSDVIHTQRPDDAAALAQRHRGHRLIVTIHGDPLPGIRQRHGSWLSFVYRKLEAQGVRFARYLLFIDSEGREAFTARYPRETRKFRDTETGVDLEIFRPLDPGVARNKLSLPAGPLILFAGRLEEEKNVASLVEILRASETHPFILIAGAGSEERRLRVVLNDFPHRFLGVVPHHLMPELYSAVDATVLPSIREAMPMAVLESLACGTPVVSTPTGRVQDIVRSGVNGATAVAEPALFAHALDEVLESADRLRLACRATAERFGWSRIVQGLLRDYREAAA